MITLWIWDYHQTTKFDKIYQIPKYKSKEDEQNIIDYLFEQQKLKFLRQSEIPDKQAYDVLVLLLEEKITTLTSEDLNFIEEIEKPVLIWEKMDAGTTLFRHWQLVPNLKAIFKNRLIRDRKLLNGELYRNRYHFLLVYRLWKTRREQGENFLPQFQEMRNELKVQKRKITKELWSLYRPVVWDLHEFCLNQRLDPFRYLDINRPRKYDVFCAGNFRDGIEGWHRQQGRAMCEKLEHKFKIWTNKTRVSPEEFAQNCADSRIVIGWYGHGEWVHADGYAFCAGMVLIKPQTDHLQMPPGRGRNISRSLYEDGRTYVACQPDFSDLEEKIEQILNNWEDYQPMLKRNQEMMKRQTLEQSVKDLSFEIKQALDDKYRPKNYLELIKNM